MLRDMLRFHGPVTPFLLRQKVETLEKDLFGEIVLESPFSVLHPRRASGEFLNAEAFLDRRQDFPDEDLTQRRLPTRRRLFGSVVRHFFL